MNRKSEYLVFERFGNRYDFLCKLRSQLQLIQFVCNPAKYYIIESHRLFIPPRIKEGKSDNL